MSQLITEAMVQQYRAEVTHLSQQKGSKLQDKVRRVTQNGKSEFFDRIGAVAATRLVGRHADTPYSNTPHSRRRVTTEDWVYADLIDKADQYKILQDPAGEYAQAAMWAMGRAKDDVIIAAADGSAWSGEDGNTEVLMPNSQKYQSVSGGAFSNLNLAALKTISAKFGDADVDESMPKYFAVTQSQISSLMNDNQVISSDYNSVKALVDGTVNSFMGFEFVRTSRLLKQTDPLLADPVTGVVGTGSTVVGHRKGFAWVKDGLVLSTGREVMAKTEELPTKNYSTQVYASMGIGATRMEEVKVVISLNKEA